MKTNKGMAQQGDRLLSGIRGAKRIDEKPLWAIVDVLRSTDDLDVAFLALTPDREFVHPCAEYGGTGIGSASSTQRAPSSPTPA